MPLSCANGVAQGYFRGPGAVVRVSELIPARSPRLVPQTDNGTGWISSALCPARSWMRWTASADGASERQ